MQLPSKHEAGISFSQSIAIDGYSSNTHELRVYFRSEQSFHIIAEPNDNGSFWLKAPSNETARWKAGAYEWRARLVSNHETIDVGRGRIVIEADFSNQEIDPRSFDELNLESLKLEYANIRKVLEQLITYKQQSYTLNGRTWTRPDLSYLHKRQQQLETAIKTREAMLSGSPIQSGPLGKKINVVMR